MHCEILTGSMLLVYSLSSSREVTKHQIKVTLCKYSCIHHYLANLWVNSKNGTTDYFTRWRHFTPQSCPRTCCFCWHIFSGSIYLCLPGVRIWASQRLLVGTTDCTALLCQTELSYSAAHPVSDINVGGQKEWILQQGGREKAVRVGGHKLKTFTESWYYFGCIFMAYHFLKASEGNSKIQILILSFLYCKQQPKPYFFTILSFLSYFIFEVGNMKLLQHFCSFYTHRSHLYRASSISCYSRHSVKQEPGQIL